MEEQGSNKSLNMLLGVVVFGIFLTITYWFFVDSFRVTIADTLANASERIKIVLDEGIVFVKGEDFENNETAGKDPLGEGDLAEVPDVDGAIPLPVGCATNIYPDFIVRNNEDNKTTVIIDYIGTERNVIIPSSIECHTVVGVVPYAFNTVSDSLATNTIEVDLKSVELPNTLTFIGKYAFRSNSLKEVKFDGSLETIGAGVFATNKLTNIDFPSTFKNINGTVGEEGAFEDNLLDTINLPKSLLTLGESAFKKNKFKKATVPITTSLASTAFDNNVKITRK